MPPAPEMVDSPHALAPSFRSLSKSDEIHVCRACGTTLNGYEPHRCLEVCDRTVVARHDLRERPLVASALRGGTAVLVIEPCGRRATMTNSVCDAEALRREVRVPDSSRIVIRCPVRMTKGGRGGRGEERAACDERAWRRAFPGSEIIVLPYRMSSRVDGKHMQDSLHCWMEEDGVPAFA